MKDTFTPTEIRDFKPRTLRYSTFGYTDAAGNYVVRLHQTDIVKVKGERITLNSGGWRTMTTKDRMIDAIAAQGYRIYADKGVWWITRDGLPGKVAFYDGIVLPDAFTSRTAALKSERALKRAEDLKKKITKFCAKLTPQNFPEPTAGDCWLCCMKDKEGVSWGQHGGRERDAAHLMQHIEEGYLHGSLIVNAILAAGYGKHQLGLFFPDEKGRSFIDINRTRRYLRKYLCGAFGIIAR